MERDVGFLAVHTAEQDFLVADTAAFADTAVLVQAVAVVAELEPAAGSVAGNPASRSSWRR